MWSAVDVVEYLACELFFGFVTFTGRFTRDTGCEANMPRSSVVAINARPPLNHSSLSSPQEPR